MFENLDQDLFTTDLDAVEQNALQQGTQAHDGTPYTPDVDLLPTDVADTPIPLDAPEVDVIQIPHTRLNCRSYDTSNDYWRPSITQRLLERLTTLRAETDNSAALVVGAGTLPFTLDVLPPTIVVADLDAAVVESVLARCDFIANEGESWRDYLDAFEYNPGVETEFNQMCVAGMARSFRRAKAAAQQATLIPLVGNVIDTAPNFFTKDHMTDKKLTFVNVTNISNYLSIPHPPNSHISGGDLIVSALIDKLPVHQQAVICDSSYALETSLYTPGQYTAFMRSHAQRQA